MAAATPPVLPVCSLCGVARGGYMAKDLTKPRPGLGLAHVCGTCWAHHTKYQWTEEELVAAYKGNATAVANLFWLINRQRKRKRTRRATQRARAILNERRVPSHKGNALRPLLRASRMKELGYTV